ncbi:wd g-beta repeat-containing [Micractinium conductrix]|uniref:Wd g-beta repeat-containing n=1 Tax=Micractinium conductrix TaxID=554055 RepID=A0A2P6VRD1_9CHLO|nr:wd g-beta repeat-containing [Micractinium conductrix]|eukprot:PSC76625.1 wd g-beta repeat-containing [Micractinium conductrix]
MNGEAVKAVQAREEEVARLGGQAAYRLQALRTLRLKTVVKESHGTSVHALAVNHCAPALGNLWATVGSNQATVYDSEHMGGHLAVAAHFTNAPTQHAPGGGLQCAAWLSAQGWSDHPDGDACLAVAGADTNISVISVVEARVVKLLQGHTKEVAELAAVPAAPRLLASLSRDGNLRLWDLPSETCLASLQTDGTCLAMAPDGRSLLLGNSKGRLQQYDIVPAAADPAAVAAAIAAGSSVAEATATRLCIEGASRREAKCLGSCHTDAIDCLRFLPGSRLASKSSDGRMFVWRISGGGSSGDASSSGEPGGGGSGMQLAVAATWKVPACSSAGGWGSRCQFGATADGRYISVGNSKGDCYVYDSDSGERAAHVSAIRVSAPVRACGLSEDCRHLMAVLGKGFVFRFEYTGPLAAAQLDGDDGGEQLDGKENTNSGQQEVAAGR